MRHILNVKPLGSTCVSGPRQLPAMAGWKSSQEEEEEEEEEEQEQEQEQEEESSLLPAKRSLLPLSTGLE